MKMDGYESSIEPSSCTGSPGWPFQHVAEGEV